MSDNVDFWVAMEHGYLLQRGGRHIAQVNGTRATLEQALYELNQPHFSTPVKLKLKQLWRRNKVTFLMYDSRYEKQANELHRAWQRKTHDDYKIGILLGYAPDIVKCFCGKTRGPR